MSLRARMGLAGGVAVAIAVLAVAFTAYEATRSQLKGQVDASLHSLSCSLLHMPGLTSYCPSGPGARPASAQGPGTAPETAESKTTGGSASGPGLGFVITQRARGAEQAQQRSDPDDHDEGLGLDDRNGPGFGGAAGLVTLVKRDGGTYVPKGQRQTVPVTTDARNLAKLGRGHFYTDLTVKGTEIRALETGIGWRGALLVALPLTDVNKTLNKQAILLLIIAAAGIGLAALLGFLVARTALAPIARFTRQTEEIAANPERLESQRLLVHGSDELARLGQTFNLTLDALEESVGAQRNLVADASHELRTPIATIRANLQLMRDEELLSAEDRNALRRDVIEELDELTALVGDVVELARGAKPTGEQGDVRLDDVAAEAIERARRRAPQLTVASSLEPTLVRGEGDRIARAVNNLLDNAAKWSPPGATIEVGLSDGLLSVRDHGPGFHDEDLPFVFDRFHRARDARSKSGSGLGLAIVRQAADAHHGFVQAMNADGGGALMRINFGPVLEISDTEDLDVDSVRSS